MRTLGGLLKDAEKFDPFENVEFWEQQELPDTTDWTAQDWLMNLGAKEAVRQYGWDVARKESDRRSRGNSVLDKYLNLTRHSGCAITKASLTAAYRASVTFRLNQPVNGEHPQGGWNREL
jgi:hypothetical protein